MQAAFTLQNLKMLNGNNRIAVKDCWVVRFNPAWKTVYRVEANSKDSRRLDRLFIILGLRLVKQADYREALCKIVTFVIHAVSTHDVVKTVITNGQCIVSVVMWFCANGDM